MLEFLTSDELEYLARVPSSIEPEILGSSKIKQHYEEIVYLRGLTEVFQNSYLDCKRKVQTLIRQEKEYPEFLLDLSNSGLRRLPPEFYLIPRRAKYFYLDLSANQFTSYYEIRRAITRGHANHPIPFDAINLEGNPLKDLPMDVIERGKFSTENIEKYWMKHWAKPYTLASRITDVVGEHRFNVNEVRRLLDLLTESLLPDVSTQPQTQESVRMEPIAK